MMKIQYQLLSVFMTVLPCCLAPAQKPDEAPEGYHLVWSDEFDEDGPPNPDNWIYERGFVRNEELQWYQEKNVNCRDGLLVIEARRERVANTRFDPDAPDWRRNREFAEYTSACVLTRGKQEWKYGRFAIRGRIDTRPGLWPAFWTLGSARGWPGCGEIDVMEYYAGKILANVCWQGRGRRPIWDDAKFPLSEFGPGWTDEFHIWQLHWTAEEIVISVDDRVLNTTSLAESVNEVPAGTEPFREPHYILLNLAVGGTNGGDPSGTEFPVQFEVDYVRVYQQSDSSH